MFDRHRLGLTGCVQVSSISIWARLLIPSSAIGVPTTNLISRPSSNEIASFALTVTSAILSFIAFIIVGVLPRQPPCHFQSPYTYSAQSDLAEKDAPNVSQNIEASVIGTLLFTWVTPVIRLGHKKEQMGLDDLPHLSASFRTITLFRNFRSSARHSVHKHQEKRKSSSAITEGPPRDGLGYAPKFMNRLFWRLIVINKLAFSLNCGLAFVTAFLYYLPAFFLQKVVAFLEIAHQVGGNDKALGYAYCFGLFISLVLDALITQQLWYISNCMLASRIKVQLNSVIFAKTLKVRFLSLLWHRRITKPSIHMPAERHHWDLWQIRRRL